MKKVVIFVISALMLIPGNVKALDAALAPKAKSAILIEASTGKVIFENNADEQLAPASMTKIMSMLLIVEAIEKGVIKCDEMVTISANASSMGGSQILLETGEEMSVEDLFKGIAIASGNDAVVALAEKIAGTEEEFVKMMNDRAKELGLKNTYFKNPHGLDTANHYSSARDMSIMARELVKHKKVLEFTSIYETYLRENLDTKVWLVNTNKLVRFYKGVDGLKTGYTEGAGYCLTATANKNNMRLIAVVMGEPDSTVRNSEATAMLDYGYAQYELETLLTTDSILGTMEVDKGDTRHIKVVPKEDITFLNKKLATKTNATYKVKIYKVKAPIKVGDEVGKIEVYEDDNVIREVPITVKNDVNKANMIRLYFRYLGDIINGNVSL
jgi:D-alanyl-D-alanine carboxypeptidase (penicillin-binding protein 5/6)